MKQEDEMYDTMMVDVVNLLVLPELIGYSPKPGLFEVCISAVSQERKCWCVW